MHFVRLNLELFIALDQPLSIPGHVIYTLNMQYYIEYNFSINLSNEAQGGLFCVRRNA